MDAEEQKKIQRMTDNLGVDDDALRELEIEMQVDLGEEPVESDDNLEELQKKQAAKQKQEMDALLAGKNLDSFDKGLLENSDGRGQVITPFAKRTETVKSVTVEETTSDKADESVVEEKKDARVSIKITKDKMHCYLNLKPATGGGRNPSVKMLEGYLLKKGVTFGVDKAAVKQVISLIAEDSEEIVNFEVATGRAMEPPINGQVKKLFDQQSNDDFAGEINTEDGDFFGLVTEGQPLLELVPSVPGRSGQLVDGTEIKAEKMVPVNVVAKRNVKKMANKFIASVDGIAFFDGDAIIVKRYADGSASVKVAEDKMSATLTLRPALGDGLCISKELVMQELEKAEVVFGIMDDVIESSLEKIAEEPSVLENILVAKGELPVNGINGQLVFKVRLKSDGKAKEDQSGKINFKEKGSVVNVLVNSLVAIQIPPQEKIKDGSDVLGNVLEGLGGNPVEVIPGENIETKEDDKGIKEFYSKIDGQVFFESPKINVEPLYVVDGNLTLEVGNIDFYGNVLIRGNVEDGFVINAGGDVEITGNLGSSIITAKRDVTVGGGVMTQDKGEIRAGRDIRMKFAENAKNIIAVRDIEIERAALNSEIAAGNSIICKKDKGSILGGHLIALHLIEVKNLGSEAGTRTDITIGMDYFEIEQLNAIVKDENRFIQAGKKIELILEKIEKVKVKQNGELPDEMKANRTQLIQKQMLVQKKLHQLKLSKAEIMMQEKTDLDCQIIVHEELHTDVMVNIRHNSEMTKMFRQKQRIFPSKDEGLVRFEPLVEPEKKAK